jgi:hypothetical protein
MHQLIEDWDDYAKYVDIPIPSQLTALLLLLVSGFEFDHMTRPRDIIERKRVEEIVSSLLYLFQKF